MIERFLGLPELASAHGGEIDRLLGLVHGLILVVFAAWGLLFLYLLIRFRRGRQSKADAEGLGSRGMGSRGLGSRGLGSRVSVVPEVLLVLAEAGLLFGIALPLWSERTDRPPPPAEALEVRILAQQFVWNVHYPGPDGAFGRADVKLVNEETNPLGLDPEDSAGEDDVTTLSELHLPVGRPVLVHLSSKDVIHGFAIPTMRIKQDAIPGLSIPVWWTPTVTTEEMRRRTGDPGFRYEIACAQLCGNSHYSMKGYVTVHTAEEFDAWLAEEVERNAAYEEDDFWTG